MHLDVVTVEIIRNRVIAATREMALALARTAFSPLLTETKDFGVSIASPRGELWAETPGASVFSQVVPFIIRSALERHGSNGFAEGDIFIVNDPYVTGTHISDTTAYMPVFWEGELIAFALNTTHWSDIGGKNPGGWCPDTTDVFQEGICFSHERLLSAQGNDDGIWSIIRGNVRVPEVVLGDLGAQIACCRVGAERIRATCHKYGADTVAAAMADVLKRTATTMRRMIAELPDGCFTESTCLDFDGVNRALECKIVLTIDKKGDRIKASFEGTSETAGGPINLPEVGTRGAVANVVKGVLMGSDATNDGHSCVDFDIKPRLLVSPQRPAPTDSYGYAVVACSTLTLRALAHLLPQRVPAGTFPYVGLGFSRTDTHFGKSFVYIESLAGGQGALPDTDGATAPTLGNGDVPNTPVEVQEHRYPFLIERLELNAQVAGAGRFNGGLGILKDYRFVEPNVKLWFATENSRYVLALGLDEGHPGAPNTLVLSPGTKDERTLTERNADLGPFSVGDLVRVVSGGGGGRGHPMTRDPQRVLEDVRDGFRTTQEAEDIYGVAITRNESGALSIDCENTRRMRGTVRLPRSPVASEAPSTAV